MSARTIYRGRNAARYGLLTAVLLGIGCDDTTAPPDDAPNTDLEITKTVSSTNPVEGTLVTFTVTVRNNGPIPATAVFAGDTLPTGLEYVSHTANVGTYATSGLWTIGNLGVGAEAQLSLTARPGTGTQGSTITNVAGTVSQELNDSVPGNNVASASVTVAPPVSNPTRIDLGVTKTVSSATPAEGANVTYTVTVTNHGPIRATSVTATDSIPTGMTHVGSTASQGTYSAVTGMWVIDTLSAGNSATLSITARPNTDTEGDVITNRAHVIAGNEADSVAANNHASAVVTVGPPVTGGPLLLDVRWSTATGSSDAALTDGGKFDNLYCSAQQRATVLSVVSGSTAGWTLTPNVLQVTNAGAENCAMVENSTAIPDGVDYYVRMYIRVLDENQPNFHPFKINVLEPQVSFWLIQNPNPGVNYRAGMIIYNWSGPEWHQWWPADPLAQGQWYRFEYHVDYIDVAQRRFRIWPRVYNMAGDLLYDASTYMNTDIARSLAQSYANGEYGTFASLAHGTLLALGYEGNVMATPQGRRWFYAGLGVSLDDWVGPLQ